MPATLIPSNTAAAAAYNPLHPAFRDDPHPFLRKLRDEDPVHWSSVYQVWVITRYADALAALRDPRLGADTQQCTNYVKFFRREGVNNPPSDVMRHWMLQMNPPDHTRLRSLVSKAFTPRVIETMRPRIERIAGTLLDAVEGRGRIDVIHDFAFPLPILVIAELLGTPAADYELVKKWSIDLLPSFGPVMSAAQAEQVGRVMAEFGDYFKTLIAARRQSPGNDLIDGLIAARDGANRLSDAELISTCILLVLAGHLSTVQLIANGMVLLLRNPQQLERLRAEPKLAGAAVEEILRFESPLQVITRAARENLEIGGKHICQNQMVLISVPGANRDPERFTDPDRFDITRAENRHIAFGYGDHFCAGAALGRLEGQVALSALVRRYPKASLAGEKLERDRGMLLRGLTSLPLNLGNGAAGEIEC